MKLIKAAVAIALMLASSCLAGRHVQSDAAGRFTALDKTAAVRAELAAMKSSQLWQHAKAAGATDLALNLALDADNTQSALIELVLDRERSLTELLSLKTSDLWKRAIDHGTDHAALEMALDADDTKSALIELILQDQDGHQASALSGEEAEEEAHTNTSMNSFGCAKDNQIKCRWSGDTRKYPMCTCRTKCKSDEVQCTR